MREQLITLETAKLARQKGFKEHTDLRYVEEKALSMHNDQTLINWKDYRAQEFIEDCETGYRDKALNYFKELYYDKFEDLDEGYYLHAPTQSHLQKWLREVHNISVEVTRDSEVHYQDETRWIVRSSNWNNIKTKTFPIAELKFPEFANFTDFKSYEEALEKGLMAGLNFIDNEKI